MNEQLHLDTPSVLALYGRYAGDLKRVRESQRRFYKEKSYPRWERHLLYRGARFLLRNFLGKGKAIRMRPQLDDVEAEITYMLIRDRLPRNVVEISPFSGWSTSWILNALKDNRIGRLYSFDLLDDATWVIPHDLSGGRWVFVKGDVRGNLHLLPDSIDYLFMDSDHSAEFAHWYIGSLFPRVGKGVIVSVHDVFHTPDPSGFDAEGAVIVDLLRRKSIEYFTASPSKNPGVFREITELRASLGLGPWIHWSEANSMIFFVMK